jgi:hypothetical protein
MDGNPLSSVTPRGGDDEWEEVLVKITTHELTKEKRRTRQRQQHTGGGDGRTEMGGCERQAGRQARLECEQLLEVVVLLLLLLLLLLLSRAELAGLNLRTCLGKPFLASTESSQSVLPRRSSRGWTRVGQPRLASPRLDQKAPMQKLLPRLSCHQTRGRGTSHERGTKQSHWPRAAGPWLPVAACIPSVARLAASRPEVAPQPRHTPHGHTAGQARPGHLNQIPVAHKTPLVVLYTATHSCCCTLRHARKPHHASHHLQGIEAINTSASRPPSRHNRISL